MFGRPRRSGPIRSYLRVIFMSFRGPKALNDKEERSSAEPGEKRVRAKENIVQPNTNPTQSGERVSQGLSGVREAAKKRRQERFTALLHHGNVDLLRDSYYALKRQAAPGVDGVTWQEYETGLENRLTDLYNRVHRGSQYERSEKAHAVSRERCIWHKRSPIADEGDARRISPMPNAL
jgi:hypothetical protein